jgi:hypothetical protein
MRAWIVIIVRAAALLISATRAFHGRRIAHWMSEDVRHALCKAQPNPFIMTTGAARSNGDHILIFG